MTSDDSKRPAGEPDPALSALALLLEGLHHRGMKIGVDDARRVALAFRKAGPLSRERRIGLLKALLARSDQERQLIEQLTPYLFVDAPAGPSARGAGAGAATPGDGAIVTPREPDVESEPPVRSPRVPAGFPFVTGVVAILALGVVVAVAKPHVTEWLGDNPSSVPTGSVPPSATVPENAAGGAPSTAEQRAEGGAAAALTSVGSDDEVPTGVSPGSPLDPGDGLPWVFPNPPRVVSGRCEGIPEPFPWGRWAKRGSVALGVIGLIWFVYLVRRMILSRRQLRGVTELARAKGPRVFETDYKSELAPLDGALMREAAFQLSAPRLETFAPWIAARATVEATARNLGQLSPRFERIREHVAVLLLEDVSTSMVRWPGYGQQLSLAIERQGTELHHLYFLGEPKRVYRDPDLTLEAPLELLLGEEAGPVVLILSDGAAFDHGHGEPTWIGTLSGAIWFHPQPPELWGVGARFLAQRLSVQWIASETILRQQVADPRDLPRAWRAPSLVDNDPATVVRGFRGALGEPAFWLLAGAALLIARGTFTTRMLAALRSSLLPAPLERSERIWSFPTLRVGADGSIRMDEALAEELVRVLRLQRPDLHQLLADWLRELIARDLESLQHGFRGPSLAAVLADIARLRIEAELPSTRDGALERARSLRKEGLGEVVAGVTLPTERSGWSLGAFRRVRTVPPAQWASFVACIGIAIALFEFWTNEKPVAEFEYLSIPASTKREPGRVTVSLQEGDSMYVCEKHGKEFELVARNANLALRAVQLRPGEAYEERSVPGTSPAVYLLRPSTWPTNTSTTALEARVEHDGTHVNRQLEASLEIVSSSDLTAALVATLVAPTDASYTVDITLRQSRQHTLSRTKLYWILLGIREDVRAALGKLQATGVPKPEFVSLDGLASAAGATPAAAYDWISNGTKRTVLPSGTWVFASEGVDDTGLVHRSKPTVLVVPGNAPVEPSTDAVDPKIGGSGKPIIAPSLEADVRNCGELGSAACLVSTRDLNDAQRATLWRRYGARLVKRCEDRIDEACRLVFELRGSEGLPIAYYRRTCDEGYRSSCLYLCAMGSECMTPAPALCVSMCRVLSTKACTPVNVVDCWLDCEGARAEKPQCIPEWDSLAACARSLAVERACKLDMDDDVLESACGSTSAAYEECERKSREPSAAEPPPLDASQRPPIEAVPEDPASPVADAGADASPQPAPAKKTE
jgi:hypothetical protein